MTDFERFVAIDWSGAGTEDTAADLAAVLATRGPDGWDFELLEPSKPRRTRWRRREMRERLAELLAPDEPRTLVAVDSGFTYPYGTARALLDEPTETPWRDLVRHLARAYAEHGTARAAARAVNDAADGPGPFRFNDSRNDCRFYTGHQVGYFRQVEMLAPQVISTFYMGSGAAVGFHTITFLAAVDELIDRRERDEVDFQVWMHEAFDADDAHHLLAECYPSLFDGVRKELEDTRPDLNAHERDAMACARWLVETQESGELADYFEPRESPVGRRSDCSWTEQLAFEGWILGVPWPT
ncbi:hypothetical protein FIV42_25060 [Persicimonas caeni]|uniref:DUF429 domain-containing protein n=1 Tax=Persicimonas caeni TaxID=2292766 RepID=A0A4Y6Q044_PERCE|nr:hypothetical protein [Persicimonas caeni]QDG53892.1 hypothetical protein FIV42_25060 [Persicimonas caeni]QED35113.1 hypothetical protein FRD00_25055 [Persicimonas caeni]